MSGVFNSGMEWWQLAILLTITVIGIISIRLNFDVNEWMKRRDSNKKSRLMNICPHAEMMVVDPDKHDGKNVMIQSLFIKPPGTLMHQCSKCGLAIYLNMERHERQITYYLNNPKEYNKAISKFDKILKKMGKV